MKQKGFTLIELLVVIAIIGLLASVVLVALNGARQKARVAKRVTTLAQLQKAIELYYNDNNSYPDSHGAWFSQCNMGGFYSSDHIVWDPVLLKGIVPTYISSFPSDPSMDIYNDKNCLLYISNGTDYKLLDINLVDMTLDQINQNPTYKDPAHNDVGVANCGAGATDTRLTLSIFSSGARCWR